MARARSSHMETTYAEGILRRGQKKGEERSRYYGRALRRTRDAKSPRPQRVARVRTPALLRRSTDVTASLFASRLADRLARAQRR